MADYSLADMAAATGEGFGGNSWLLIVILIVFLMGGGGFNRGDYGQYATAASQQEILFGQRFSNLDNKMDRLGNGIADATYALNNTITNEGRNIQMQMADVKTAVHAEGEATRAMMQQNKIESLQGQINQLQLQNAMCGVVRYPTSTTYALAGNPFCNCGCGNNSF